jgi:hypothetical protein
MRRSSNSNASAIPTKCNALLNLVAGLLGVGFDDFKQRDFARSQKRLAILSSFSSPVVAVMAGLTFWALNRRRKLNANRLSKPKSLPKQKRPYAKITSKPSPWLKRKSTKVSMLKQGNCFGLRRKKMVTGNGTA